MMILKSFLMLVFAFLTIAPVAPVVAADTSPKTILMVKWRGCEDACQGFQDYIAEQGMDAEVVVRDAERDAARLPALVEEARTSNVDLVVTWGTSVTLGMVGPLGEVDPAQHITDIPVVFMIVADPIGAGIVESYERSGRANVTGTRNRVPEEVQMKALQAYKPFSRLGVIYNTNEQNAVLKLAELEELAQAMGFEIVARALPLGPDHLPRSESIPDAVAGMKAEGVDWLYVSSSSFLVDHRELLSNAALEQGLPLASAYEQMVTDGHGLIAVAARYYNVGRLAGEQAKAILIDGATSGNLPIRGLDRFAYIINVDTARQLDLFPSMEVLQYAETVD
jgi:putative tryptophan/tyrosine transport system substrate-binding protein